MAFWFWIIGAAIIIILAIEPLRNTFFGKPGEMIFKWGWWFVRQIFDAHICVFKNLITPRSLIYKTLESEETTKRE